MAPSASEASPILVSPAEPTAIRALGFSSRLPEEEYGADLLWMGYGGLYGVQRKELRDLIASVHDGRLQQELPLLRPDPENGRLRQSWLLVEGHPTWSADGFLLDRHRWTFEQHHNLLRSVQSEFGVFVAEVGSVRETVMWIRSLEASSQKEVHDGLLTRPFPTDQFGRHTERAWKLHLLQGFPRLGAVRAGAILDANAGQVPLRWTKDEQWLREVPGIGKKIAGELMRALGE